MYKVTVRHEGQEHTCNCGDNEIVLYAMWRSNMKVAPRGCGGGGCGVCKVRITAGTVTCRRMSCEHITEKDRERGIVLACCITPASDIELFFYGEQSGAVQK
ncbi:MAG: 2Fe-2S iron-sulfur cluster-binding protein [Oscillospiraceae bacterium]|nr:2Fe-2S iron-sulfur cluster-binding protein [Oscillospiraceae bacterium]